MRDSFAACALQELLQQGEYLAVLDGTRYRWLWYGNIHKPSASSQTQLTFRRPPWSKKWGGRLWPYSVGPYNKEQGLRHYPPLAQAAERHSFFLGLLEASWTVAPIPDEHRFSHLQCEVQGIAYRPRMRQPAFGTPRYVHRDRDRWFVVWALNVINTEGSLNVIAKLQAEGKKLADVPQRQRLAEFTLTTLGGYAVADEMVAHHVEPTLLRRGCYSGERLIVIASFKRLVADEPA